MEKANKIQNFENQDRVITFDPDKFSSVLKILIPWILVLFFAAITIAFLAIRYTKPLYESKSILKLDIKSEASVFGLNEIGEEQSYNNLLSEIELLKSKLFYNKIIDAVNLKVNVFTIGNILDDERYKNAPFDVDYKIEDPNVYDLRFRVEILNANEFNLSYTLYNKNYNNNHKFEEIIHSNAFEFTILKTEHFDPNAKDSEFFFRINSRNSLLDYIEKNFSVQPLKLNTNTIEISFKDYNKQKARDMANAIDTIYLTYSKEEKTKANAQKIKFLNEQLETTEKRLSDFEDYFEDFIIDNKSTDLQNNIKSTISLMNSIDSQRYLLQIKLSRLEELKNKLDSGNQINLGINDLNILPNEVIEQISELNELLEQSESILLSYNRNTQAYRIRTSEIKHVYQRIFDFINEYIADIKIQLKNQTFQKARLERNFVELPSKNTEYSKSQRYYSLYEEFYLSLMQKKAEFQLALAGIVTDFKILSPATIPNDPLKPQRSLIYGISIVAWIVVTFFMVGIGYLSFNKITSIHEVERLTDIPVLGSIPKYTQGKMPVAKLVVGKQSKSAIGEAFRTLRTNMQFIIPKGSGITISISSTVSGEGKSFIGVNLAAIFALSGKKVLLMDVDMRKPKLNKVFNPASDELGVSTILIGKNKVNDCIIQTGIENFDVLLAGHIPPNPSELIMSSEMDSLLHKLKKSYDYIIIDTPPIGIVTDGILIMKKTNIQTYIVRSEYSKSQFIDYLEKTNSIHHFNYLYIILNSVKSTSGVNYGYGYGSGYYRERKDNFFQKLFPSS